MSAGIEFHAHNNTLISVKDFNGDLNISDNKWSHIFDVLLENSTQIYFKGFRINYLDDELYECIQHVSEKNFITEDDFVLFKVKRSMLILSRNLISRLWDYYEYPSFIFLKSDAEENELISLSERRAFREEYCEKIHGIYMMYRGIELDVLWIEKSSEMSFENIIND